jgi:ParB family chromosome partitioning protein
MSKTQLVPCVVREGGRGVAEEDSLAENVQRVALHPLDQFRAFQTLRDKGLSEEDIAARFFVNARGGEAAAAPGAVSEKLLDVYAEDGMTLEQLMAFTVTNDHARQEQVWEALQQSYDKEPYLIRRQLTESAVRGSDRRAQFVGIAAYEAAGGVVLRDLFEHDDGGWLQDVALLDRLVDREAGSVEAEKTRRRGLEVDRGRRRLSATATRAGLASTRRRDAGDITVRREQATNLDALKAEQAKLEG